MKNKKVTAGVLAASMVAPMAAQLTPVAVMAAERENCDAVYWRQDRDCRDNSEVKQGLSFRIQNTDHPYEHVGLKIYKLPDDTEIGGTDNKGGATLNGEKADNYDLSKAEQVASIHSIGDTDGIWINPDGSKHELDKGMGEIGCNTCISLPAGKYVIVHDEESGAFGSGDSYKTVPFIVGDEKSSDTQGTMVNGKIATLDIECVKGIEVPKKDKGNIQIQAVVVETDDEGNVKKDESGNFILTGEKVSNVKVKSTVKMSVLGIPVSKDFDMITDEEGLNTVEGIEMTGNSEIDPVIASILEYPEGWELADPDNDREFTFDLVAGETAVHVIELYKIPENDDDNPDKPTEVPQALRVIVVDKDTGEEVEGAGFTVTAQDNPDFKFDGVSKNGGVDKTSVLADTYIGTITSVPEEYLLNNNKVSVKLEPATEEGKVTEIRLVIEKNKGVGDLDVIVRDKDTKEPIPGATVVIKDKDGNVIDTIITDEEGKINKPDLPIGDYTVEVIEVPDGYTPPEPQDVTIEKDKTSELIFEVEKGVGNLDVIVRDKDTKKPIPGAKVEILDKDGKVIKTVTTDKDGKISEKNLPVGDYTIKVTEVPEGYTAPADQTAKVEKGKTTEKIFELEKGKGALNVLIRDKDTKEPIPDAKVQILDKDGKVILEAKTNKEGRVEQNNLPAGDYTIKVIEVPDGYSKPADTVAPVKVGKRTNVIFELEKGRGNLEVTIRDKDTKKPIPGAVVQIADKNGTLITTLTTDSNGQIKKENLPIGDYIIRVQEVPEGYKIPETEKATVKKNETAKVLIELEKSVGALEVIVRDKDTKEPIPGAKVVVVDEKGNTILETTTNENGRVEKDKLPVGKYTIKVVEVPDGYKAPNDQDVTIKRSVKTTVIFELEKPKKAVIPNIVQTGDNNNIFGLIGVGIASVAGMIFVSKKNKKDEK